MIAEKKLQQLEDELAPWIAMLEVTNMSALGLTGKRPHDATLDWDWKLSLAKWVRLVRECQAGRVVGGGGAYTCGLCRRYLEDWCDDCPITHEGEEYPKCIGTPQARYVEELLADEPRSSALLQHAMDELAFLLDLWERRDLPVLQDFVGGAQDGRGMPR